MADSGHAGLSGGLNHAIKLLLRTTTRTSSVRSFAFT